MKKIVFPNSPYAASKAASDSLAVGLEHINFLS